MDADTFVHEWVNAYNDQDFDRFGTLFTDDVAYTCIPARPSGTPSPAGMLS
ncbi:hypothetical protein [Streptomyces sp. NPDC053427]|uniref:hypothetical protein n=1 Tax=Streptomyces sp. NPDC053427 TaxID=3365701 RepID=UPI0037CEAB24